MRGAPLGTRWRYGRAHRVDVQIKRSATWKLFAQQVGQRIRAERERRDIAASELAAALGSCVRVIHRWESGINPPHLSSLIAISMALGCTLNDLLPTPIVIARTVEFGAAA